MNIDEMTTHELLRAFQERIEQSNGLEFCSTSDIRNLTDTLTTHLAMQTWEKVQA
jgi:hypothetical protein